LSIGTGFCASQLGRAGATTLQMSQVKDPSQTKHNQQANQIKEKK
jgi:hypothetical protein